MNKVRLHSSVDPLSNPRGPREESSPLWSALADLKRLVDEGAEPTASEISKVLGVLRWIEVSLAARQLQIPTGPETYLRPGGASVPAELTSSEGVRLLTAEDVAARFGRSVAWVYRQAKHWNFTRRITRKTLRFSEGGLQRFLAQRRTFIP